MSTPNDEDKRLQPRATSLLAFSLGTFGIGLFVASRHNKKARLRNDDPIVKIPQQRPFNPQLYALKALGIATAIVGVTAICAVGVTTWYLDVYNMDEFHAKMKPFFRRVRPKGFRDAEVTEQDLEWEKSLVEDYQKRIDNKKS